MKPADKVGDAIVIHPTEHYKNDYAISDDGSTYRKFDSTFIWIRLTKQFILAFFYYKNNSLHFHSMFFLQVKGRAMDTISAPCYENPRIEYHEKIEVYFIIKNTYNLVVRKYFEKNWFRTSGDSEVSLNTNLIIPNNLLSI